MAFNLKKVLKALLLSSGQPLSIKDIQAAFTRFHEQASLPVVEESAPGEGGAAGEGAHDDAPHAGVQRRVVENQGAGVVLEQRRDTG